MLNKFKKMENSNPLSIKDIIIEMFGSNLNDLYKNTIVFDVDKHWDNLQKKMAENAQKEVKRENLINTQLPTFRSECWKILTNVLDIVDKKNKDYGYAFDIMINKYGLGYAISKMEEKTNRASALLTKEPNFESMEDTLKDIIGYATLTLRYLYNKNRK